MNSDGPRTELRSYRVTTIDCDRVHRLVTNTGSSDDGDPVCWSSSSSCGPDSAKRSALVYDVSNEARDRPLDATKLANREVEQQLPRSGAEQKCSPGPCLPAKHIPRRVPSKVQLSRTWQSKLQQGFKIPEKASAGRKDLTVHPPRCIHHTLTSLESMLLPDANILYSTVCIEQTGLRGDDRSCQVL